MLSLSIMKVCPWMTGCHRCFEPALTLLSILMHGALNWTMVSRLSAPAQVKTAWREFIPKRNSKESKTVGMPELWQEECKVLCCLVAISILIFPSRADIMVMRTRWLSALTTEHRTLPDPYIWWKLQLSAPAKVLRHAQMSRQTNLQGSFISIVCENYSKHCT